MTHYKFYYSRWQCFIYLLLGGGLILVGTAMINIGLTSHILLTIMGPFLILAGLFIQLIALHRLLTNPAVLDVGPQGIAYRYGTFSNRKVMWLPWENIEDIKFGDITYQNYTNNSVPLKLEYITITVTTGFLKEYHMFRDNIFITGNDLRITTNTLVDCKINPNAVRTKKISF
ncbi:hypothetical protein, partial [Lactiplantibacillus fabifermentans]|uniref:hypothetical protein n=1 Tax=Lactiplantibacillus fabifermentans TaxID=483011 RepID=UPI00177EB0FF